jgi:hypothetical protein
VQLLPIPPLFLHALPLMGSCSVDERARPRVELVFPSVAVATEVEEEESGVGCATAHVTPLQSFFALHMLYFHV